MKSGDRTAKNEAELEYWISGMTERQRLIIERFMQRKPKAGADLLVAACHYVQQGAAGEQVLKGWLDG